MPPCIHTTSLGRAVVAACLCLTAAETASAADDAILPGANTIKGRAAVLVDGVETTCAGRNVALTDPKKGVKLPVSTDVDSIATNLRALDLNQYVASYEGARLVVCDETGGFAFPEVADGTYRLVASLSWTTKRGKPGKEATVVTAQTIVQLVTVTGGETKEVGMAPIVETPKGRRR